MRGRPGRRARHEDPGGVPLVHHHRLLRQQGAHCCAHRVRGQGARREPWTPCRFAGCFGTAGAHRFHQVLQSRRRVLARLRQPVHRAALGYEVARLTGVGEEGDRWGGVHQHQVTDALELDAGQLAQVRQPLEAGQAGTALEACRKGLAEHGGAGGGAEPCGRPQSSGPHGRAAQQQGRSLAGPQSRRCADDRLRAHPPRSRHRAGRGGLGRRCPRHVGRHHQRGHAPGRATGGGDRVGAVAADLPRPGHPVPARHRAGGGGDVGVERRIELPVVGGVIADQVDDRAPGAAGVVQIGQPVVETGAQVQQAGGRPTRHSGVAVGGAGGHPLEEGQHPAHLRDVVQGGHDMQLRGTRIGEAGVHPGRHQGPDERLRAVHLQRPSAPAAADCPSPPASSPPTSAGSGPGRRPGPRMPRGSNAALMRRRSASFTGSSSSRK